MKRKLLLVPILASLVIGGLVGCSSENETTPGLAPNQEQGGSPVQEEPTGTSETPAVPSTTSPEESSSVDPSQGTEGEATDPAAETGSETPEPATEEATDGAADPAEGSGDGAETSTEGSEDSSESTDSTTTGQ